MLDHQAAENIKEVLDKCNISNASEPDNRVITVIDKNSIKCNPTYLRRAKGLVKNGRAKWVDDTTIQLLSENPIIDN